MTDINTQFHAMYALWLDKCCDLDRGESNYDELFDSFHRFLRRSGFVYASDLTKAALLPMLTYLGLNYHYEPALIIEDITLKQTPRSDFPKIF
jgi:hypothetical protein